MIVYYHIHSSGLSERFHDVLSIGAVSSSGEEFERLVRPRPGRAISPKATAVNGFTTDRQGGLYKDGKLLSTVCLTRALHEFCTWLRGLEEDEDDDDDGEDLLLVAHNGRAFHQRFLLCALGRARALGRFRGLQAGFDDSRRVLAKLLGPGESLALDDLALNYLRLPVRVRGALQSARVVRELARRFGVRFAYHDW